jgi:hypothetical protein
MSTIGSINSNTSATSQTNLRAPTPEMPEVKAARDKESDSRAEATKTSPPTPSPTVNASGQKIGQVINDAA